MRCDACAYWETSRYPWEAKGKCLAPLPASVAGDAVKVRMYGFDGDDCSSFKLYTLRKEKETQ